MPPEYGDWKVCTAGFTNGTTRVCAKILETLVEDTDFEGLMIDARPVRAHPDTADARG